MVIVFTLFGGTVNVAMGVLMRNIRSNEPAATLVYACFGVIAAEVVLVGIGSVLAPGHWLRRTLITLFVLGSLFLTVMIGVWIEMRFTNDFPPVFGAAICWLPMILLSAQAGPWINRSWRKWRIRHVTADAKEPPTALQISDLLFATAYVAVTLTVARGAMPGRSRFLVGFGIVSLTIVGISVLTTGIFVRLCLRTRLSASAAMGICVALSLFLAGGLLMIIAGVGDAADAGRVAFDFGTVVTAYAVTVSGFLCLARRLGFRLDVA